MVNYSRPFYNSKKAIPSPMDLLVDKYKALTLTQLQHTFYDRGMATVILFEGSGGMAMSHIINQIIAVFEPRNVTYNSISNYPGNYMKYCLTHIAPEGKISIFDRGWYSGMLCKGESNLSTEINFVNEFERYLYNNEVNLIKIYLDIKESNLKKHKKSYPVDLDGESEVFNDAGDMKDFSIKDDKISTMIDHTNTKYAPWDIVEVKDYKETINRIADFLMMRMSNILRKPHEPETYEIVETYPNCRENVDFSKKMDKDEYNKKLDKLQRKLAELQIELANSDKALVLVFEGWDAAGKGGIIKRVTQALNPRGYKTYPTPAPTKDEKAHTHLWRFTRSVPAPGRIAIFDRSWYGRMMVEPIEGFCTEKEYSRAAEEINLFEALMHHSNIIVLKFWVDITKEEQLKRFNERASDPLKQWKLTDEDWRNREKWDVYEKYVNSMIMQTNTAFAPWIDVESVDKRYGRIKVLQTIVDTLKKELDD